MTNLTKEQVHDLLTAKHGDGIELVYIDYRDRIEDAKTREELLQTPENDYEIVCGDWMADSEYETIDTIIRELEEENGVEYTDETKELIKDWCYEHNTSNPIKDLLRNTGSEYLYYDTGINIEPLNYYEETDNEIEKRAKLIATTLKVDYKKHENSLHLLVEQAGYGGQLVILFTACIEDFMQDAKYIKFNGGASVCIMDRANGSGDNTELNEEMVFDFKRENLHSDKGDNGYSYTYKVCGLVGGLYEDGFLTDKKPKKLIKTIENEEAKAKREREAVFEKRWKAGECSFGDMNISRHKETPYRNDYPCGSRCEDCGTFWID